MAAEFHVNLSLPPEERWCFPNPLIQQAEQLLEMYLCDLGGIEQFAALLSASSACVIWLKH